MKRKRMYLVAAVLVAIIVVAGFLWFVVRASKGIETVPIENVSIEENLFATYEAVTVDFRHPDDMVPIVLPPTADNIPIYNIGVKSYDFDENKTGLMYETSADNNQWCRIRPLASSLWAYYFDDYQENRSWDNGQRWNPDFNDVILVVWKIDGSLKIKAVGSPSTFRNELWVGGARVLDNVEASLNTVFEVPVPARLR